MIALGRGDPDLDTPPHIVEAGRAALLAGATHYTHPLGMPQLREAIAASIAEAGGATYSIDEIVVTAGAQEWMFVAMLALVEPRRRGHHPFARLQLLPSGRGTRRRQDGHGADL